MLGMGLNEALEYNVGLLCSEFSLDQPEIVSGLLKSTNRDEINTYLEDKFPGQIKIID